MAKTISFYIRSPLREELDLRGSNRSSVINRDLERLYALYHRAIREVPIVEAEAYLICDSLNGSLLDANTAQALWAGIADSIRLDGLDVKWQVDGPALVEKLRGLNALQAMALVDAAERFWVLPTGDRDTGIRKLFSIVGDGRCDRQVEMNKFR